MTETRRVPAVRPHGTRAFTVEFDDVRAVMAHHAAVVAADLPGVAEVVPAARTIWVEVDTTVRPVAEVAAVVQDLAPQEVVESARPVVEIPVRYDGPDLEAVAALAGATPEEVVRRHTRVLWTAAFTGFAPGFAYLVAESGEWLPEVPRRAEPRVAVPAGAVALAGEFSGIYPRSSPGGWQLIGSTGVWLWDLDRPEPALVPTGVRVRFVEVG